MWVACRFFPLIESLVRESENLQLRPGCSGDVEDWLFNQIREYYQAEGWEILDFVDVEKSLACRLTDNDLGAMLACIDAKSNLKRLSLTHCFNIVGHGLEPLRSSAVLERLDLGLVRRFEAPQLLNGALLSEGAVFPILHDIVHAGTSFRRLSVPMNWCNNGIPTEGLLQFLGTNKRALNCNSLCCYFGFTGRLGSHLNSRKWNDELEENEACITCGSGDDAEFRSCAQCNKVMCTFCEGTPQCERCFVTSCKDCSASIGDTSENSVRFCEARRHNVLCCNKCRLEEYYDCGYCMKLAVPVLKRERDAYRSDAVAKQAIVDEKQALIDAQRLEIDAQREQIEVLRLELDELHTN